MCERLEREKRARGRKGYNNNRHDDTHITIALRSSPSLSLTLSLTQQSQTEQCCTLTVQSEKSTRAEEDDTILHSRDEESVKVRQSDPQGRTARPIATHFSKRVARFKGKQAHACAEAICISKPSAAGASGEREREREREGGDLRSLLSLSLSPFLPS